MYEAYQLLNTLKPFKAEATIDYQQLQENEQYAISKLKQRLTRHVAALITDDLPIDEAYAHEGKQLTTEFYIVPKLEMQQLAVEIYNKGQQYALKHYLNSTKFHDPSNKTQ